MPFARKTLSQLISDAAADIASAMPGADALLRFSNLGVLGKMTAGFAHLHYGFLDWIARQAVPFTATEEFLEGWAGLKNVTRKPAQFPSGSVAWTGVAGTLLPSGTLCTRGDGVQYQTIADANVDGTSLLVTAPVVAIGAGAEANCDVGVQITLGVAVPGIQSNGAVTIAVTGGTDLEADDSLRSRMLEAYQAPPQGGSFADYLKWTLDVSGVTRAWCSPNGMGIGTVLVYFMMDLVDAAFAGFPQGTDGVAALELRDAPAGGDQLLVANALFPLQPVTPIVYVAAPVAFPIDFTISGISPALRAAVGAEIANTLLRVGSPGGVRLPDGKTGGAVDVSDIESAIAAISGTEGFLITIPAANLQMSNGKLPTLGVVTWT